MIAPNKVAIDRSGTYQPTSIRIAFIGPPRVDTLWALSLSTNKIPIHVGWDSRAYEVASGSDSDIAVGVETAIKEWREENKHDWLLLWTAGIYLTWDAIEKIVKTASEGYIPIEGFTGAMHRRFSPPSDVHCLRFDSVSKELTDSPVEAAGADLIVDEKADPERSCVICVPTLGKTSLAWANALFRLEAPAGIVCYLQVVTGRPVDDARETLIDRVLAMNPKPKYVMFLGDDMLPPPNGFQLLMGDIEKQPDLITAVGGLYRKKSVPTQNVAWRRQRLIQESVDYEVGQVAEVDGMGLDFCILRTEDLLKIEKPRFLTVQTDRQTMTEDTYFWRKFCSATNKRPFVDTSCMVGHYDLKSGAIF